MQRRTTQAFLPPAWILVLLTLLCCGMFCHQEPVALGALSRDAGAASQLEAQGGIQEMSARISPKMQQQVLYPLENTFKYSSQPSFFTCSSAPLSEAFSVTLFSKKALSQSLPDLWHGFSLCSRSPPAA